VDGDRLDDAEVSLVLRRAVELDHWPASRSPGVDLAAVEEHVRRWLDLLRERRLVLREVHRLDAVVAEEPGGDGDRVVVRLELDVRHARRSQTALLASGGAVGAAVVGGTLLAAGLDPALLVAGPLGGGIAAAGHGAGAWLYRRQVEELTLAAEGVLDRLEQRARVSGSPSRPFLP